MMKQKQLFRIVLVVLVVGVILAAGMNYFHNKKVKLNRTEVIKDLNTLASDAQNFYKNQLVQGTGKNSFQGYEIPLELSSNYNGNYNYTGTMSDKEYRKLVEYAFEWCVKYNKKNTQR